MPLHTQSHRSAVPEPRKGSYSTAQRLSACIKEWYSMHLASAELAPDVKHEDAGNEQQTQDQDRHRAPGEEHAGKKCKHMRSVKQRGERHQLDLRATNRYTQYTCCEAKALRVHQGRRRLGRLARVGCAWRFGSSKGSPNFERARAHMQHAAVLRSSYILGAPKHGRDAAAGRARERVHAAGHHYHAPLLPSRCAIANSSMATLVPQMSHTQSCVCSPSTIHARAGKQLTL